MTRFKKTTWEKGLDSVILTVAGFYVVAVTFELSQFVV